MKHCRTRSQRDWRIHYSNFPSRALSQTIHTMSLRNVILSIPAVGQSALHLVLRRCCNSPVGLRHVASLYACSKHRLYPVMNVGLLELSNAAAAEHRRRATIRRNVRLATPYLSALVTPPAQKRTESMMCSIFQNHRCSSPYLSHTTSLCSDRVTNASQPHTQTLSTDGWLMACLHPYHFDFLLGRPDGLHPPLHPLPNPSRQFTFSRRDDVYRLPNAVFRVSRGHIYQLMLSDGSRHPPADRASPSIWGCQCFPKRRAGRACVCATRLGKRYCRTSVGGRRRPCVHLSVLAY
ncbi:hypothetical protein BDW22DRAFT_1193222 [Trametopsis cervina]|nr:hypothetical protein BDW22DRAFT_1193222 [Trametopsis cervina]